MGISGMDKDGKCSAEMTGLTLFGTEPFKIVSPEEKKVGDLNLAFFSNS